MWLAGASFYMGTGSEIRQAIRSVTICMPFLSKNCQGGFLYVQRQVAPDLINEKMFLLYTSSSRINYSFFQLACWSRNASFFLSKFFSINTLLL